jgi:hypothetical protein
MSINKSLSALGNVILGLSKGQFINFRESKLTRILQNSLKGDSKIVLMATVSSLYEDCNETLSTLQFANRCKQVITMPHDNTSFEPKNDNADLIREKMHEMQNHYQK